MGTTGSAQMHEAASRNKAAVNTHCGELVCERDKTI